MIAADRKDRGRRGRRRGRRGGMKEVRQREREIRRTFACRRSATRLVSNLNLVLEP